MDVILLGSGSHAKDVITNIEDFNRDVSAGRRIRIAGCLQDRRKVPAGTDLLGYPVFGSFDIFKRPAFRKAMALCAVGDPLNKRIFVEKAGAFKLKFASVIHPTVLTHSGIEYGEGLVAFAHSVVSACCRIGRHVTINYSCSVSHDCVIGDYSTLSPGVNLGGKTVLKEGVFVGIGACSVHEVTMGDWSVIGGGATVTKDILGQRVAVGSPAKVIRRRDMKKPVM